MSNTHETLPGQETVVASWEALAQTSAGARVIRSSTSATAVFPAWEPLNNAITLYDAAASSLAAELGSVYAEAGVDAWALWVPSPATDLAASDQVRSVEGLRRDATTLVMQATLRPGRRRHDGVLRASLAAANRAGDEPVPVTEIGEPMTTPGFSAWLLVDGDVAVASAWSFRHGTDCGIYAVGTVPAWRRRGLATTLLQHVLADAEADGAVTATLQSTPMAVGLYESLGFVAAGRYEEWVSERPAGT